jgi:hypothetical protein
MRPPHGLGFRRGSGLCEAVWHPEFSDCRDDDRDGVIGVTEGGIVASLILGRPEQGEIIAVGAMKHDWHDELELGAGGVSQGFPCGPAQVHGCKEAEAPRFREDGAVICAFEDRCVGLWGGGEYVADSVVPLNDGLDRGKRLSVCRGDMAIATEKIDEPLIGRDRDRSYDDGGDIAVEHGDIVDLASRLFALQPAIQRLEVHRGRFCPC